MKKAFAVFAVLVIGILLFGCTGGGSEQQNTAPSNDDPVLKPFCGYPSDLLTTEKLKAAGFQGTADLRYDVNYILSFDLDNMPLDKVKGLSWRNRGSACEALYRRIVQDDCFSFYVNLRKYAQSSAGTEFDYRRMLDTDSVVDTFKVVESNEFGDASFELYQNILWETEAGKSNVPNKYFREIIFSKGKTNLVFVRFAYNLEQDKMEKCEGDLPANHEKIIQNAKVIAKLIDQALP